MNGRGDVVVRVRRIAEDRAAAAASSAISASMAARNAADLARERARTHPLDGQSGSLRGDDILATLGMAAALRESAAAAERHVVVSDAAVADARRVVDVARSERKAAERIVDRRRAAWEAETVRRDQRTLDEAVSSALRPR